MPSDTCPLQALSDTIISRVPHAALRDVAARLPAVAEAFWRQLLGRWSHYRKVGGKSWTARCQDQDSASALRNGGPLRRRPFERGSRFPLPAYPTQLADATGLTPVHINRTLKALASEDVLHLASRKARIPDWKRLVEHGEFETGYLQPALEPHQSFARPLRESA